ncbi:hypothetical protein QMZ30_16485 [Pantoea sp. EA-12]|uniref:gp53-like domain-containing protein n=1 Tax=Pantoea sp. EA-12 TaxID=3043303 RepID=UPI0024B566F9|nr:hypothetical protein [Pantoea sp. EA-12]MDI9222506.1 hypothetical protein [Pantoea sp. EA-12]
MDRQIVYPGQIPLETDLLNTNKFAMIGLAKLSAAILGQDTCLFGLACTPSVPTSMTVSVGEGQIYSLQSIDGAAYSSLPADTTNSIVKQGLLMAPMTFTLKAPVTAGQSINYLIQVAYSDVDSGPTVLPYYNAANPAIAYSGPDNAGTAQSTIRSGACHITVKAGIASARGAQMTPPPDAGYTSAWVITVNYGDRVIDSEAIRHADGAPFLPADGLISAIQQGTLTYGEDTGTANHYQIYCHPAVSQLSDGMRLHFRAKNTNTGPSSFGVSQLPEASIFTTGHEELQGAQITQGQVVEVEWNNTLGAWILCSSSNSFSRQESDKRYLSLEGGEVKGTLRVEGTLSTDRALEIGKSKLTPEGDISGELWEGSLNAWLKGRSTKLKTKKDDPVFIWKDPGSKLIMQGGHLQASGGEVKFPAVFPRKCFIVTITQSGKHNMSKDNSYVDSVNNLQFTLHAGSGETSFYWLAVGW